MIVTVVTAPTAPPVSVAEAKAHSYITTSDDDDMIERMVYAATTEVESVCGMALMQQTLKLHRVTWPDTNYLRLVRYPLQSVTSVNYVDVDGDSNEFSSASYWVDTASEPGRIWLNDGYSWPSAQLRPGPSITATYVAGYASASAVPSDLKAAVLMIFGELYEHRERTVLQPGVTQATISAVRNMLYRSRRYAV